MLLAVGNCGADKAAINKVYGVSVPKFTADQRLVRATNLVVMKTRQQSLPCF